VARAIELKQEHMVKLSRLGRFLGQAVCSLRVA
jgi:hypothetical protein